MKLRYSITHFFELNSSYTLDAACEPSVPYLIIIAAAYVNTAFYVGVASLTGGSAQFTSFIERNLNVTLLPDGSITIRYDYDGGPQPLYINIIRLA